MVSGLGFRVQGLGCPFSAHVIPPLYREGSKGLGDCHTHLKNDPLDPECFALAGPPTLQ